MKIHFSKRELIIRNINKSNNKRIFDLFNNSIGKNLLYFDNKSSNQNIEMKKKQLNNNIIKLKYKINEKNNEIKILGTKFVIININKVKIILYNKKKNLVEKINHKVKNISLKIKLKFLDNIINIDSMFKNCKMLYNIKDFSNINIKYINSINSLFYGCSSLILGDDIYDISNWNTRNIYDMSNLFFN